MLKYSDKIINKIQQILISTKAKFVSKKLTNKTRYLIMILKKSQNGVKKKSPIKINTLIATK